MSTLTSIPLGCECRALSGTVEVQRSATNRLVCYCDDCRAFVQWLGQADVLDQFGGSDLLQIAPGRVAFQSGAEHLACLRLSPKGMHRWYAGCCRTPIGNTMASSKMAFVSLNTKLLRPEAVGLSLEKALGPVVEGVQARFALGAPQGVPRLRRTFGVGTILRLVKVVAGARLRGHDRPSPFFDDSGCPSAVPRVLAEDERRSIPPTPT